MTKIISLIFLLSFSWADGLAQHASSGFTFIPEFKWRIKIPDFLITENKDEWKKVQNAGKDAINDTYGIELKNNLRTIFIFKSADESFFEAVSEPIDRLQAKNYAQTCERMNDIFYNSLKAQVPSAQVDTMKWVASIDGVDFQVLKATLTFPSGLVKTTVCYRSVFKALELTVSVMYSNKPSGEEIINAFEHSTFGKE